MAQILDVIQGARTRLTLERHWARGSMARTLDGGSAEALDMDAAQWCALGALHLAAARRFGEDTDTIYEEAAAELAGWLVRLGYSEEYEEIGELDELGEVDVISIVSAFNDSADTHADMLGALDMVIARLEHGESAADFDDAGAAE